MPYYEQGYVSEIIIVDAHSTDGTLEAIKGYPAKLLFEEVKGSIGMAYELGWRNAQGELIILMNADVYFGQAFYPKVYDLLSDDEIGLTSCQPRAVVTNRLTKAQGEEWVVGTLEPTSRFQRLYSRIAYGGAKEPLCGGPCQVVRRICLEAVNGLQGLNSATAQFCDDISFSQRIANKGWKTIWWMDAPVYHHPRATFKGLTEQHYRMGKSIAYMHLEEEFRENYPWYGKVVSIIARLGSPLVGLMLAIRFRNPMHLIVYPPPRYAWVIGYIVGWIGARNKKERNPNQSSN
jgi:glycosyltransferase involved in cell wall biosynthesis